MTRDALCTEEQKEIKKKSGKKDFFRQLEGQIK